MITLIRFLFTLLAAATPLFAQLTLLEEGGTFLPGNLAPAGTAFAKDVLPGGGPHTIPHLNDATYGNANSWISNSAGSFAGISLGATPVAVNRIAFGRDNLGSFGDRAVDLYTIQYTTEANPNETTTAWTDIGTVDYREGGLVVANPALRHAFSFPTVNATGFRIVTLADGICIDELELANFIPGTPTDIVLSASTITENNAAGTTIGTLTATDEDAGDTHTFTFAGGPDDAAFTITGNTLTINGSADFETKPSYSIRIRATDSSVGALTFEKNLTITVGNVVDSAPVTFDGSIATTIPDHNSPGYTVMDVTAAGPDAGTDFTYSLAGGADDAAFTLTGNVVTINGSTDFQTKQSYTLRLRATNTNTPSLFYEEDFTFYVRGKALDVQFNDASIVADATVNIGVQFPGDTTTFVLKNNGILPITLIAVGAQGAYSVTAVGSSAGGTGSGSGSSTGNTGSGSGSSTGSGSGGTTVNASIAGGQTAFVTLTLSNPDLTTSGNTYFYFSGDQDEREIFTIFVAAGIPTGPAPVFDTFTATSGVTIVSPLANDGNPNVTITRVVGGGATIAPDGRRVIVPAGFTGALSYVTSTEWSAAITIVAGTPVATPKKWAGLLRDANGKITGRISATATKGKYTAALNVGHVKKSAKFTLGTPATTKLGTLNATLDSANHLQVTLGTNTGDLRPLVLTTTAAKYNAALQAIAPNILGGGYAKLTVKKNGGITITGTLPDGTKFSAGTALTDSASASIYTPAKATNPKATLAGEVALAALTATDITGEFAWVKPAQTKQTGLNASGVDTVVTLNGSIVVPAAAPTNIDADCNLIGADFSTPATVSVLLTRGKSARKDPLKSFIINGKTGGISGSVIFPVTNKAVPFQGVFLQKNTRFWGFIKGSTDGGRIEGELD